MKKFVVLLLSLFLLSGSVFARGIYSGDVQFHAGVGFDNIRIYTDLFEQGIDDKSYDFDIDTWHLFKINDLFSVGFVESFSLGFGESKKTFITLTNGTTTSSTENQFYVKVNNILGPAVGFTFKNIVRLNLSAGFSVQAAENDIATDEIITTYGIGVGGMLQAKFFPKDKVSPVIGLKSLIVESKNYMTKSTDSSDSDVYVITCNKIQTTNISIYAGISFNW